MGGLAVKSYDQNSQVAAKDANQNTDIDLLVARSDYLKVKAHILDKSGENIYGFRFDLSISKYIDFKPQEEFSFLIFRDIKTPVRSVLFEPREVLLNGYEIKTVPAITLFHTFAVCGGILRPKDWEKILPVGRYIRLCPDNKFSESDYKDFHNFLDIRKEIYPRDIWFLGKMQILLSSLPSFYGNIAWKIRKRILKRYFGSSKSWR